VKCFFDEFIVRSLKYKYIKQIIHFGCHEIILLSVLLPSLIILFSALILLLPFCCQLSQVAVSRSMQAVKLYSNKILQFLTRGAA